MQKKILLLEDDKLLGETLCEDLESFGYIVTWIKDGQEAADITYDNSYDLYLFDVNVPNIGGFELLESLRQSGDDTPCVFLTARSSIEDLKSGFNAGADDYVIKPFDLDTLLIRMEAKIKNTKIVVSKNLALDVNRYELILKDRVQTLPKKEFEILKYFVEHKDRVISKDEIITWLYEDEYISDTTFRVYIKNLNNHLQPFAKLINIRGVGYRFEIV